MESEQIWKRERERESDRCQIESEALKEREREREDMSNPESLQILDKIIKFFGCGERIGARRMGPTMGEQEGMMHIARTQSERDGWGKEGSMNRV